MARREAITASACAARVGSSDPDPPTTGPSLPGCAVEELISFHDGLDGPQTRPFTLHPKRLPSPPSRSSAPSPTRCSVGVAALASRRAGEFRRAEPLKADEHDCC